MQGSLDDDPAGVAGLLGAVGDLSGKATRNKGGGAHEPGSAEFGRVPLDPRGGAAFSHVSTADGGAALGLGDRASLDRGVRGRVASDSRT